MNTNGISVTFQLNAHECAVVLPETSEKIPKEKRKKKKTTLKIRSKISGH